MAEKAQKTEEIKDKSSKKPVKGLGVHLKRLRPRTRSAKVLAIASAVLLVSAVAYAIYEQLHGDDIVIGDTRITKNDRDAYMQLVEETKKANPELDFGGKDGQVALNDLLLNAAFKQEAKKRGDKLTSDDLIKVAGEPLDSKEQQQQYLDNLQMSSKLIRIRTENEAYKKKYSETLLIKKDLLISHITFDTPLHARASAQEVQRLYNQGAQELRQDILPLMKSGASRDEIAKLSDVVLFGEHKKGVYDYQQYFDKLVIVTDYMEGYDAQQGFNEINNDSYLRGNVGKLYSTNDKIAQLKKVGDTTDVFASKAGSHMIIRLEGKSKGTYNSWDEFLDHYKNEYVGKKITFAPLKEGLQGVAATGVRSLTSIGLQEARAQVPGGCGSHVATLIGRAYDQTHKTWMKDATRFRMHGGVNQWNGERHSPNACEGTHGDKTAIAGAGSPNNTIIDNCYTPPPSWAIDSHPAGYTFQKVRTGYDPNDPNDNRAGLPDSAAHTGWPDWRNDDLNGKTVYIVFSYTKPINWKLKVTTQMKVNNDDWESAYSETNPAIVWPGDTVKFQYRITNTGDDPSSAFQRRINITGRDGSWTSQGSLGAGDSTPWYPSNVSTTTINIPQNAAKGTTYCGRGWADRTSDSNSAELAGNRPCAKVDRGKPPSKKCKYETGWLPNPDTENCGSWGLVPNSSVNQGYVEQGGSVTFNHTIDNNYNNGHGIRTADGFTRCVVINGSCGENIPASIPPGLFTVPDNEAAVYTAFPNIPRGTTYCQAYSVGWERDDKVDPSKNIHSPKTSNPACVVVVGGTSSIRTNNENNVTQVEPGESANLTATISTRDFVGGGGWPGYTVNCGYNVTANGNVIQSGSCARGIGGDGDQEVVRWGRNPAQESDLGTQYCLNVFNAGTANPYYFTGQAQSSSCFRVIARPYFKVYGGDVVAGCAGNSSTIVAWNKNGTGNTFNGAGGSLAVFAQGIIRGFASGQTVPSGNAFGTGPTNLSFANGEGSTVSVGGGIVSGGSFGGNLNAGNCKPDYFASMPTGADIVNGWPGVNEANRAPVQSFYVQGNIDMTSIAGEVPTVTQNSRIRLYVKGDVFISKDILPSTTSNDAIEKVPSITVVARNIYISPNVGQLYGTYVAQQDSSGGGNIYTCASGIGSPLTVQGGGNPNYNACKQKQLVFTGSVVAKKIHLLRTWGSLYQDGGGAGATKWGVAGGPGYNAAGEVFRFNPLVWQRESTGGPETGTVKLYDSITTLPPAL